MRILLPSLLFLAAAGCTATPGDLAQEADAQAGARAGLDRELAGFTPERPQDCVQRTQLREMSTFGETLVYRGIGAERYVTRTTGSCQRAGDNGILVTSVPSTQLCRGDTATVVDRNTRQPIGSCIYGDFTRYSRAR